MDERNWILVGRCDALGTGFEEFVCFATNECKQVWYDGYVEIFEMA